VECLSVDETKMRACGVMRLLVDESRLPRSRSQLLAQVERQLRALLKIRSRGKVRFRFISRVSRKEQRELKEEERYWRAIDRLEEGGPEVEVILEKFRARGEHPKSGVAH
jgi:hypothetical protein